MRSTQDLRHEFDWVDATPVDTSTMHSRIQVGIDTRRIAQRRRVAVLSVAAAAILIAVGAIVIPSLGSDRADRSQVATIPSGSPDQVDTSGSPEQVPESGPLRPTRLDFTVGEQPSDYTLGLASTSPGLQLAYFSTPDEAGSGDTIEIALFDPDLSGRPVPEPTGETLSTTSPSGEVLNLPVVAAEPAPDGEPVFALGWQTPAALWLTVSSVGSGDRARQAALDAASQVDLTASQSLTFPFQVGYVPDGMELTGAEQPGANGEGSHSLSFDGGPAGLNEFPPLLISARNLPGVPPGANPNTTVGQYQAEWTAESFDGPVLSVYDVGGFIIGISVRDDYVDLVDEAQMRRIAESIMVIPGAASDPTVWTDQPIG